MKGVERNVGSGGGKLVLGGAGFGLPGRPQTAFRCISFTPRWRDYLHLSALWGREDR